MERRVFSRIRLERPSGSTWGSKRLNFAVGEDVAVEDSAVIPLRDPPQLVRDSWPWPSVSFGAAVGARFRRPGLPFVGLLADGPASPLAAVRSVLLHGLAIALCLGLRRQGPQLTSVPALACRPRVERECSTACPALAGGGRPVPLLTACAGLGLLLGSHVGAHAWPLPCEGGAVSRRPLTWCWGCSTPPVCALEGGLKFVKGPGFLANSTAAQRRASVWPAARSFPVR